MDLALLLLRVLLTALLYAFLGGVLLLLWRELRETTRQEPPLRPAGRLVVVEAGERGPEPGTAFPLQEVTSLGRTPANTVVLPDPFVSARHALLAWREGRWWLEDQGSKNGTTLNGEPVTRPTVVSAGDLIGLGQVVLRMETE
ncbi:MAG TPA: FHA domain-containing protein [Chloroflexi bacterium]|nr:FHA domain-containing protein [Chloroflexota bacterium]